MSTRGSRWKKSLFVTLLVIALAACFWAGRRSAPVERNEEVAQEAAPVEPTEQASSGPEWWTCSMHPQVKLPSGDMKCPICFMDLIPVEEGAGEEGDIPEISLSERARFLAEVETALAERKEVTKSVRLVGKIQPDETSLSMVSARVPGRLDRLFVDYTGMNVRAGDHLVEIYSPELISAQQELLQAIASQKDIQAGGSNLLTERSESLVVSSRKKLLRFGLTEEQVEEIVENEEPRETLTIYSPVSGIVIERIGTEGMYVGEGSTIYTIADLANVWLLLQAYESDLQWLHYGQRVEFEAEAYPGETFAGTLSFISPVLDEMSRTVALRVNVPNEDFRLKPGMFARAVIHAVPSSGGKIIAPEMSGKWICPMHPEVVEDLFGFCPVCEMPLETAKSLGYVGTPDRADLPLVIPDTAPLRTGKRAVVYVESEDEDGISYQGRVVKLGPHADGYYIVESGLDEGDRVVTKGNFKIDSALQIQAKTSMMTQELEDEAVSAPATPKPKYEPVEIPEEFAEKASLALQSYLQIQEALAGDSLEKAKLAVVDLESKLEELSRLHPNGPHHDRWMSAVESMRHAAHQTKQATEIEPIRASFYPLSMTIEDFVRHFGTHLDRPVSRAFCPMALEAGATWLQTGDVVANPYYGASMLRCGEIRETFPPQAPEKGATP